MDLLSQIVKNPLNFFWWLSVPLLSLMKIKLIPDDVKNHLNLDPNQPVLYVLPKRSLADLLVLFHFCKKLGLPLPRYKAKALRAGGTASYLYLGKLGLLQPKRDDSLPPLQTLCERSEREQNLNVQLVPVSIIWGRSPGKEAEKDQPKSFMQLLFPDDEHAGVLQKFFIVLAQGRDTLIHFGKPISLREQVDLGPSASDVTKKIRRVLRVHFRTQRLITLGPKLYDRNRVIEQIIQSKASQAAIQAEMRKSNSSRDRAESKARYYLREIASSPTHSMVKLFDRVLTFVWNRIYDGIVVRHSERLRELADRYEIIFVPSHRSHLDYLVLPYELYYMGLNTCHTAAGVNLNFWPLGPILRRGGAFFLRRSFRGNRLYTTCFTEYLRFLLTSGHSITFFPEGGRSRTGRLLAPKTGMLSMFVDSYIKDSSKPIVFIPLYIGYDKVIEVKSYFNELRGMSKKKENFWQLLGIRKIFKSKNGKAYLGFGEPLFLEERLNALAPDWKLPSEEETRPAWFPDFIDDLSTELMTRINRAAVVGPVSLSALALLSTPQRALPVNELLEFFEVLLYTLKASSSCPEVTLPEGTPESLLSHAEKYSPVSRFTYPGSDVIYLNELEGVILSYYRNNILHLFALPSLIASYFQHNDEIPVESLLSGCEEIYPFLKTELFLQWNDVDLRPELKRLISALVDKNLLTFTSDGSRLARPDVASFEFSKLKLLGRILGLAFERYSISAAMLSGFVGKGTLLREEFESKCQLLAQRISILNGVNDPEFYDKSLFKKYVDTLHKLGYLRDDDQEGYLTIDPRIKGLADKSIALLSPDIWQSIQRITGERRV